MVITLEPIQAGLAAILFVAMNLTLFGHWARHWGAHVFTLLMALALYPVLTIPPGKTPLWMAVAVSIAVAVAIHRIVAVVVDYSAVGDQFIANVTSPEKEEK